ncbi:transcription termination factor NusA [Verrucomicrobium spinosum]|uniref:transcription termination factor NusA n=1 Tax=Verrucomicrobium spinosum TaxID=2736 RepID=UPI0001745B64|nr:transcription termination factor NusA [Verrucomicrobium spinosum]
MVSELKALFEYYEKEKGIDRSKMVDALQSALLAASKKSIGPARELRIEIDPDKGSIRAFARLLVSDTVENPFEQLSVKHARKLKADAQPGDEVDIEVTPKDFGRIAAQTAKQTWMQRLREAEKANLYDEFKDRTGDVVSGTIRRFDKSDVVVDLGKFEGIMTSRERVPTEDYTSGDRMRFYVKAVEKSTSRGPEIILSRSHPNFVRRLFEFEVSEIADRTVEIVSIAREAGYRTKVAVHSADDKVDPVGACVGLRGARVKNIVRELNNEKVDIIRWSKDVAEFTKEALKPIKILSIKVDEDHKRVLLTVSEEELSKAIGRKGQNARLTSRLIGYDLVIEKDEHAAKVFESHVEEAVHRIAADLDIDRNIARKLVGEGLSDLSNFADADVDDIASIVDGDTELAQQIVDKVAAITSGS